MYRFSEASKKKFYQIFETTEERVNLDVEIIKKWMKTQRHLPELMDDVPIKNFLNLNKFSIERTKQKIDNYYTLRSLIPEMFANPKQENIQSVFDNVYFCIPPKPWNLHRIQLFKPKKPNCFPVEDATKLFFSIFEVRLYEDFLTDDIFILDMANLTFHDMSKYTPSLLLKLVTIYQKVYSLRLKEIHYLNAPSYVSLLMSLLKKVLKPKIFQRIQVHPDAEILKKFFSEEDLPRDYGGKGQNLEESTEVVRKNLLEYEERFDLLDSLRVEEGLRPERLDNDEILGFYGNFKKLDVD